MANFDLSSYETVEERLQRYLKKYPDARFIAKVESNDGTRILMKAAVYQNAEQLKENLPHATGYAEEVRGEGYVNKTSHVENCETSAVGRALANAGYSGNKEKGSRASREEMEKVQRLQDVKGPVELKNIEVGLDGSVPANNICEKCGAKKVQGKKGMYCKPCYIKYVESKKQS